MTRTLALFAVLAAVFAWYLIRRQQPAGLPTLEAIGRAVGEASRGTQ